MTDIEKINFRLCNFLDHHDYCEPEEFYCTLKNTYFSQASPYTQRSCDKNKCILINNIHKKENK